MPQMDKACGKIAITKEGCYVGVSGGARYKKKRPWWKGNWNELILFCAVAVMAAVLTLLLLLYFFPLPGTK